MLRKKSAQDRCMVTNVPLCILLGIFCLWYHAICIIAVTKNAEPSNIGRSLSDAFRECR